MNVITYKSSHSFYEDVRCMLEQNLLENNLLIGLLLQSMKNGNAPLLMAVAYKDTIPVLACLQTIPEQAIVAFDIKQPSLDCKPLAELLAKTKIERVIGLKRETMRLAETIAEERNTTTSVHMQQRLYTLKEVSHTEAHKGTLVKMTPENLPLITEWISDFQTCITPGNPLPLEEARKAAEQQLIKNGLYLYVVDGVPVSMANLTRPVDKTITINLVYTPVSERKKGYASDCVAALSKHCLQLGYESLLLYTDLSNPTSNHIYQLIGYKALADSVSMQIGRRA